MVIKSENMLVYVVLYDFGMKSTSGVLIYENEFMSFTLYKEGKNKIYELYKIGNSDKRN